MNTRNRLYVLDDNKVITTLIEKSFKAYGFTVKADNDADNIIEKLKLFGPDIILIDVDLIDYDGIEICKDIKMEQYLQDIPVIFISHITDTDVIARGLEAGGIDYVYKPIDPNELLARIKIVFKMKEDAMNTIRDAKKKFIKATNATVHHEINQPLSVILLSAELLESRLANSLNEKERNYIQRVKNSVGKIKDILYRFSLLADKDTEPEVIDLSDNSKMLKLPQTVFKTKVLVLDDIDEIREAITDTLNNEGIEVLTASNLAEAERLIAQNGEHINTIYCDVRVGDENGIDLYHSLRRAGREINFVFITGYPLEKELKEIQKQMNIPVLKKPFTRRRILLHLKLQKEE